MSALQSTYENEISQIVTDTFQTMLATDTAPTAAAPYGENVVTALVSFGGSWKGALALECGDRQAVLFAQRFLQMDDITEVNGDVCDSMGELANIVAGNLKSVLPSGLGLGTPSVVQGHEYRIRFCGGKIVTHCFFSTDVGVFSVYLVETSNENS